MLGAGHSGSVKNLNRSRSSRIGGRITNPPRVATPEDQSVCSLRRGRQPRSFQNEITLSSALFCWLVSPYVLLSWNMWIPAEDEGVFKETREGYSLNDGWVRLARPDECLKWDRRVHQHHIPRLQAVFRSRFALRRRMAREVAGARWLAVGCLQLPTSGPLDRPETRTAVPASASDREPYTVRDFHLQGRLPRGCWPGCCDVSGTTGRRTMDIRCWSLRASSPRPASTAPSCYVAYWRSTGRVAASRPVTPRGFRMRTPQSKQGYSSQLTRDLIS